MLKAYVVRNSDVCVYHPFSTDTIGFNSVM